MKGKPPTPPGDRKSLIVPGIFESLPSVNRSKLIERKTLDIQHPKSKSYEVGLQVSSGVDSQMPEENFICTVAAASG